MEDKAFSYLKTKVMSASKEELLLLLFDSAIAFASQAKEKIKEKNLESVHNLCIKAQRIVMELMSTLNKDMIPDEMYKNLMGLYNFVYFRFVWANVRHETSMVDEGLDILKHLRETWAIAIETNKKQQVQEASSGPAKTGPLNVKG